MREATKIRDATVFLMGSNSISDGEQRRLSAPQHSNVYCIFHLFIILTPPKPPSPIAPPTSLRQVTIHIVPIATPPKDFYGNATLQ
jgi:hypothetical protein